MDDLLLVRRAGGERATWHAGHVLIALVALGLALRALAAIGSWPTMPTLEDGYQVFAKSNPFADPLHPAGYALIIAAVGTLTRAVAVLIVLQHLLGIASALLIGAATRRITGSAWAALLPAGMILLSADHIFLEHTVMSESWEVLAISAGLYAAVRALDEPVPWWRWPALTGVILGAAVVIRSAALPLIAVTVLAMIVYRWPQSIRHRGWWGASVAAAGGAALVVLVFAGANAKYGQGFEIAPSPGWYLYGQAAQFADCKQFTPPAGTASLCETRAASQRPGYFYYLFDSRSPARRRFGTIGSNDGLVGGWARRAIFAQFGDFLATSWIYLRAYWVPGSLPARLGSSSGLDPQLDFTFANRPLVPFVKSGLEIYFHPFAVHTRHFVLRLLHDWQRVVRFGATALFVTTLLTLLGLIVGTRRSRSAVILFGVGGLSLIVEPVLVGNYTGRFMVPMAGPMMAAAAVTILEIWRRYGATVSVRSRAATTASVPTASKLR